MTTTPLAFVDCETTGLTIADEPWEIAIIRRMPGGTDQEFVLHVEHDARRAETLPDEYREDHDTRFGVDQIAAHCHRDCPTPGRMVSGTFSFGGRTFRLGR